MIAVYGGSFNPPTIAHINLAQQIASLPYVSKLMIVPVGDGYTKSTLIPGYHRYNMLKQVENEKIVISDIELTSNKLLYTIDTLELIKEKTKEEVLFVLGTDNLRDITNWKEYKTLLKEYKFLVINRDNDTLEQVLEDIKELKSYKSKFVPFKDSGANGISSTMLRKKIKAGISINEFTIEKIQQYIKENNLYK